VKQLHTHMIYQCLYTRQTFGQILQKFFRTAKAKQVHTHSGLLSVVWIVFKRETTQQIGTVKLNINSSYFWHIVVFTWTFRFAWSVCLSMLIWRFKLISDKTSYLFKCLENKSWHRCTVSINVCKHVFYKWWLLSK